MKPRTGTRALVAARPRLAARRLVPALARVSVPSKPFATAAAAPRMEEIEIAPVVNPPPRPVAGSEAVASILQDTSRMLAHEVGGSTAWYERVGAAEKDLRSVRRARLAVMGTEVAAPHDVVSAILQDPLADAESTRTALLERYYGTSQDTIVISLGELPTRTDGSLATPSSWLQASGADVVEVAPGPAAESEIVAADALALVLDPIRLTAVPDIQKILPTALAKGTVRIIVNGPLPPHATEASVLEMLEKQITAVSVPGGRKNYEVSFVRAEQALRALDSLATALESSGEGKGEAFEAFQRDFIASNIGPLQKNLMVMPTEPQVDTAAATARLALAFTTSVIASDRSVLRQASSVVSKLRRDAADGAGKARRLSVVSRGSSSGLVEGSVESSMRGAQHDLKQIFNGRLSWLGILTRLRVDDVNGDVGGYLARNFARDVEQQLVYEAGQLAQLQTQLGREADQTAKTLTSASSERAGHPFSSPVLLNHLASLALSIPPVAPGTLLPPVATRRAQLVNTAVPRLQISAQRALASTAALTLAGGAGAWMAYVPPAAAISGGTAVGLGALAFVSSLALGQAWWGKAQRRFWKDYGRVTHMLKDDLAANYDQTVDKLVLARPNVTAEGLNELVVKREARLADLDRRVGLLEAKLEAVAPAPKNARATEQ